MESLLLQPRELQIEDKIGEEVGILKLECEPNSCMHNEWVTSYCYQSPPNWSGVIPLSF